MQNPKIDSPIKIQKRFPWKMQTNHFPTKYPWEIQFFFKNTRKMTLMEKKSQQSCIFYGRNYFPWKIRINGEIFGKFPLNMELENLQHSVLFIFLEKYRLHSFSLRDTWYTHFPWEIEYSLIFLEKYIVHALSLAKTGFFQRNGKDLKTASLITRSVQIVSVPNFFVLAQSASILPVGIEIIAFWI